VDRVRGFHAPPTAGRANGACEHAPYARLLRLLLPANFFVV